MVKGKVSTREAVSLILSLCDGARQLDGVGYNKYDRRIIDSLIQLPKWSYKQEKLAYKIVSKYRRQLQEFFGIDVKDIYLENNPPAEEKKEVIRRKPYKVVGKVTLQDDVLAITFRYNPDIVETVKQFTKRWYESFSKTWYVSLKSFTQKDVNLLWKLESMGLEIDQAVEREIERIIKSSKDWVLINNDEVMVNTFLDYNKQSNIAEKIDAKWDSRRKAYVVKKSVSICAKILQLYSNGEIELSDETVEKLLICIDRSVNAIEMSTKARSDIKIEGFKLDLYPFQKAGVEYALSKNGQVLIADEMGLGKTVQALATVHLLKAFPCLVVCPATLKYNWIDEIKKFTDYKAVVLSGNPKNAKFKLKDIVNQVQFVIINYDILQKWEEEILSCNCFKAVVFDESHYIKNPKAKRTKSAMNIAKNIPHKILLTGTPILNRPVELISQLKVLGVFDKIANGWFDYVNRYCDAKQTRFGWDVSGASNLDELNEKLREICMIRREKKDVLKELPEKIRTPIHVDIENEKEYKKAEKEFVRYIKELMNKIGASQEEITEKLMKISANETIVKLTKLRQIVAEGKLNSAVKWIENFFENNPNKKLVVFCYHREIQDKLYEMLKDYNPLRIHADMKPEERQKTVRLFQEDNNHKLIILGIKVGSEGITLTKADTMLFVELYWTPAILQQAEDRIHRIGQDNNVNIYYIIGRNTIDEYMWELLERKERIVKEATGKEVIEDKLEGVNALLSSFLDKNLV